MYPIIYQIGPVSVYSYGLMLAVAAIVCAFLMAKDGAKFGLKPDLIYDLVFWIVLGGIVGARIFYIGLNTAYFFSHPLKIIMIHEGGLAWQGGFAGGLLSGWLFVKKNKLQLPFMLDLAAPYVALGQAIGRIGCFLNGCCYGKHFDHGIYFPLHGDHLYPTQLYDAFGLLLLFFMVQFCKKRTWFSGKVFILYLYGAATLRFVVEFFRADHEYLFLNLSVYQWVCLLIAGIGLYVHARFKSKRR